MTDHSSSVKEDLNKDGYSQEEKYFYKLNKELIESRRKQLDLSRKQKRAQEEKKLHWMKCPKCGSQLKETAQLGICMDQCSGCHGIFLDSGELETILATKQSQTFLDRLKAVFQPKDRTPMLF